MAARCGIAIRNANGEYLTGLDDDDYFLSNRLESFVEYIFKKKKQGIVPSLIYSNYILKRMSGEKKIKRKKYVSLNDLYFRNYVGNQAFFLKERAVAVGLFDIQMPAWQDYDFWIRLINKYGVALNTFDFTYVTDISHDHERISSVGKIENAYSVFVKKHFIPSERHKIFKLYLNVLVYCRDFQKFSLIDFYRYLKLVRNTEELIFVLKIGLKYFLKKMSFLNYKPVA
ncbi:hypothetical protein GCM10023116_27750 [Kistimonas scapharcae]|uniref:Glycosyltransferase 2-like domain-containing protein n=1 Tax=Kistimonas scapharcae TaxID=1036133 RepID=A0ABP8V6C6_9GAMM